MLFGKKKSKETAETPEADFKSVWDEQALRRFASNHFEIAVSTVTLSTEFGYSRPGYQLIQRDEAHGFIGQMHDKLIVVSIAFDNEAKLSAASDTKNPPAIGWCSYTTWGPDDDAPRICGI